MRAIRRFSLAMVIVALAVFPAAAEVIHFKLLPNYSRATFKTDAPLETIVGNAVAAALTGTLTLDPAKPREAKGVVTVDMSKVKTGVDKRDSDMLDKTYLDVASNEANKFVTFEVRGVEIAGPLEPGKEVPAKVRGAFMVKQKPIEVMGDGRVVWVKLTPEQVEGQKRFGFTGDNIKVRARFGTLFTNHGMQVPQLLFLKVSNEIAIETDLTFVRQ
ncbi:MAG: YceI family protein [candidate division NC10 bacterium]